MKNIKIIAFSSVMLTAVCLFPSNSFGQVKHSLTEMNKSMKNGVYSGTYKLQNGNIAIFYQNTGGLVAYEFDANATFLKSHESTSATELLKQITSNESGANAGSKEIQANGKLPILYAASSWGSLKLVNADLKLNSDGNFINGFDFDEKDTRKLKLEDTWRTNFYGARTIVPDNMKVVTFKANNGKSVKFDFTKPSSVPVIPASGYLQTAGVIVEKVSIKDPSPYNQNRLVIFKTGGNNAEETTNIHIMPYAMQSLGVGTTANGNMLVMGMPLNAPSTVKEQKQLVAPEEARGNLYMYQVDENNKIVAEGMMQSDLQTVNYQSIVVGNQTLLIGTGAKGKNWRAAYMGQTSMDGLTIAFLDDKNNVSNKHTYLEKDFESKVEVAGTGSNKFNMKFTGGPYFFRAEILENKNIFLYGASNGVNHGMLLSADGQLIKYYIFPHEDLTKNLVYGYQIEVKGNKVYVVQSDQPMELSNEVKSNTSTSSYVAGGYKVTNTTTSKSQLFEIFHLSQVFTIDGNDGKTSQMWLNEGVKNFHTMGESPALFTNDGIYFPGRIKANKGKEIGLIKVDY